MSKKIIRFPSMAKMKSDTPLDHAVFQLSPKRSRCELFVSGCGSTEKLAAGLLKPFVAHLQIAEKQVASAAQSVKLEVGQRKNAETWFTKGTLERFLRFVSTPELLELLHTLDAEMSQLEAGQRIYSLGEGYQLSGGGGGFEVTGADNITKKELLRAIDVRLAAVRQDLSAACARAAAAGFNFDSVAQLQMFADQFGAHRLNEACSQFVSLSERRPELINPCLSGPEEWALRSSYGSDMSIDDDSTSPLANQELAMCQQPNPPPAIFSSHLTFRRESTVKTDDRNKPNGTLMRKDKKDESSTPDQIVPIQADRPARRLSVQDRINLFENKQKENSVGKPVTLKSAELRRRLSSDSLASDAAAEKAVLRRLSGASDMSIDLSAEKDAESPLSTSASAKVSQDKKFLNLNNEIRGSCSVANPEIKVLPSLGQATDSRLKGASFNSSERFFESSKSNSIFDFGENGCLKDKQHSKTHSGPFMSRAEDQESSVNGGRNEGIVGFHDEGILKGSQSGAELSESPLQTAGAQDRASSRKVRGFPSKGCEQLETPYLREDFESMVESVRQISLTTPQKTVVGSRVLEGAAGSRIREAFASRYKQSEGDPSCAQQEVSSVSETKVTQKKESCIPEKASFTSAPSFAVRKAEETEVAVKKESHVSETLARTNLSGFEDSGPQRLKFNRQVLAAELSKKAQVQRRKFCGSSGTQFSGKVVTDTLEGSLVAPPLEHTQRVRQSKGNHELNNELKMKASELEKLCSEHKLRVPGDQINSAHKGRSGDMQHEPSSSLHYTEPVAGITLRLSDSYLSTEHYKFSKNMIKFNAASPMKAVDNQYYDDGIDKKFSEIGVSEGSRGKYYERYMQKRDAKLREEWSSDRAKKEAKLKSMQDSFEKNRSEMKARISGSMGGQGSVLSACWRTESKSFNSRSIMKREQVNLWLRSRDACLK